MLVSRYEEVMCNTSESSLENGTVINPLGAYGRISRDHCESVVEYIGDCFVIRHIGCSVTGSNPGPFV